MKAAGLRAAPQSVLARAVSPSEGQGEAMLPPGAAGPGNGRAPSPARGHVTSHPPGLHGEESIQNSTCSVDIKAFSNK